MARATTWSCEEKGEGISTVGIVGVGKFGSKILRAVNSLEGSNVVWSGGSELEWWDQPKVDWVVVASPHIHHYEQAEFFLDRGTNVFLEKPATLSKVSIQRLFEIAAKNNLRLYVDDVYAWKNIHEFRRVVHNYETSNADSNFLDLVAYHYFYLIKYLDNPEGGFTVHDSRELDGGMSFSLRFEHGNEYTFHFDTQCKQARIEPDFKFMADPLSSMLQAVFAGRADFVRNREGALFATNIIEYLKRKFFGTAAVLGGGIYGCVSAVALANKGYAVDLYEKNVDILSAATFTNQYRVHLGFHYPRSFETRQECIDADVFFRKEFGQTLDMKSQHFYAVSAKGSKVTREEFLEAMDESGLAYELVEPLDNCSLTLLSQEVSVDPHKLRQTLRKRLFGCGVTVHLGTKASKGLLGSYGVVVNATYKNLNEFTDEASEFKFQLVEKIAVKLPTSWKNFSLVVMDGDFFSIDPFPGKDYHVVGAVKEANHEIHVGENFTPSMSPWNLDLGELDPNPVHTKKDQIMELMKKYLDFEPEYVGSYFVTKTLKSNVEATDERKHVLAQNPGQTIFHVLGGKLSAATLASREIIEALEHKACSTSH